MFLTKTGLKSNVGDIGYFKVLNTVTTTSDRPTRREFFTQFLNLSTATMV